MSTIIVVDTEWIADGAVTAPKLVSSQRLTTARVGTLTAGLEPNTVGSYIFARSDSSHGVRNPGYTAAGSGLQPSNAQGSTGGNFNLSGTWRLMGYIDSTRITLWQRIW